MKKLYFIYDEYVITCILVGRKGMIYSKGIAIWDGSLTYSESKGMEIAYKRAKRALKRDYLNDIPINKEETMQKIANEGATSDKHTFPMKASNIQEIYNVDSEDWFSEDENKVLRFIFSDKSSEDFKKEKVIIVRRKKIEKGYQAPEVNIYDPFEDIKAVMDANF